MAGLGPNMIAAFIGPECERGFVEPFNSLDLLVPFCGDSTVILDFEIKRKRAFFSMSEFVSAVLQIWCTPRKDLLECDY